MPRSTRNSSASKNLPVLEDIIDLTQDSPTNVALRQTRINCIDVEDSVLEDTDILIDDTVERPSNRKRSPITINLDETISLDDHSTTKKTRMSTEFSSNKKVLTCPICLENLADEDIKAMTTPCGHVFCLDCLKTITSQKKKCSLCQRSITFAKCIRLHI